jgi:hypothetical protein
MSTARGAEPPGPHLVWVRASRAHHADDARWPSMDSSSTTRPARERWGAVATAAQARQHLTLWLSKSISLGQHV